MTPKTRDAIAALEKFRQAFIIGVGDKSPFAQLALQDFDAAIEMLRAEQAGPDECFFCGDPVTEHRVSDNACPDNKGGFFDFSNYSPGNKAALSEPQAGVEYREEKIGDLTILHKATPSVAPDVEGRK